MGKLAVGLVGQVAVLLEMYVIVCKSSEWMKTFEG